MLLGMALLAISALRRIEKVEAAMALRIGPCGAWSPHRSAE